MPYYEKLPIKTKVLTLAGSSYDVDCEGLCVTAMADGNDVYIKKNTYDSNDNAFLLKNGTNIELCGHFVASATSGKLRLLYCKLL